MSDQSLRHSHIKSVIIVSSGNFLEMYDFMVFGYYASWIAKAFFPSSSEFASLMLSLGTFGAGFLMRPIGGMVLGAYMDRHGRRAGLLLTFGLMGIGTLSIAGMPPFASIGVIAPLLIVIGRLLQGFSAGVQVGGASVYLSEISTPGHKGFYVSWQSASQQMAVVFAALLGITINRLVTIDQLSRWGWRIPFFVGCALIPFLFAIRNSFHETPAFLARTQNHRPALSAVYASMLANWRVVGLGTLLATMTTVSFYLITAYTPTYGTSELHLTVLASMIVTLCVGISNFVLLPVMGGLSDKIGRRPLLIACSILALLTGYPALLWLVSEPSFARLLAVELWLSVVYAGYNGAMVVFLTEIMPVDVRTSGFSIAYSLATAVFGGFTPAVCTYLIHVTGNKAIPGIWLSAAALCGLFATAALSPERLARDAERTAAMAESISTISVE